MIWNIFLHRSTNISLSADLLWVKNLQYYALKFKSQNRGWVFTNLLFWHNARGHNLAKEVYYVADRFSVWITVDVEEKSNWACVSRMDGTKNSLKWKSKLVSFPFRLILFVLRVEFRNRYLTHFGNPVAFRPLSLNLKINSTILDPQFKSDSTNRTFNNITISGNWYCQSSLSLLFFFLLLTQQV